MSYVLVIEDEAGIRGNLMRFLRLEGVQAVEAADGLDGLRKLREREPGLVLCDVMMPRMSGEELLDILRQEGRLPQLPFYFLSASAEPERLEAAIRHGARGYLTKPFNFSQIHALLVQHGLSA